MSRSSPLLAQHAALEHSLRWWTGRLRQLRTFYFKVAEQAGASGLSCSSDPPGPEGLIEITTDDEFPVSELTSDQLPLN